LVSSFTGGEQGGGELADVWFASFSAGGQDMSSSLADALDRYGQGGIESASDSGGSAASRAPDATVDAMLSALSSFSGGGGSSAAAQLLGSAAPDTALLLDDPNRKALPGDNSAGTSAGPTLGIKT
jgi:hypothetical protein